MNTYPLIDSASAEVLNRLRTAEWKRKVAIARINPEAKFNLRILKAA